MLKDWQNEFSSEILSRGYDYYLRKRVGTIIKTNDGFEGKVQGTKSYDVKLKIKDDKIIGMSCNCPCSYHCKHEAALFYALEGENTLIDKQIKDNEIDHLISNIPIEELSNVIKEVCMNNYGIFQKLAIKYNKDLTEEQKQEIKESLYSINQCEYNYFYDDDSYINYVDDLENFIRTKIKLLIDNDKLNFGYVMLKEAVKEAVKYDVDEWDYWTDGLFDSIYEQLINLYEHGSEQFKTELLIDLKKHIEKQIFGNVIESFLINYVEDKSFQNSKLAQLDESIKGDEYGSYVLKRVELMKVMKFSETEIEDFLDKHYEKLGVRIFLLRRYLKNDQQLKAIAVIEDIMKIEGNSRNYSQKLMKLYKDNNMLDKWASLAYHSLFDNYYNVDGELYNELKKYYGQEKWQILKKEVYDKASKKQLYEYYKLDDEYEKLFDLVKKESISVLNEYEDYLKKYYPQEILLIYHDYIVDFGENAKNRSSYDLIEHYLHKMLTYPGGKEVVGKIKNDWINRFPGRRILVQRLQRINC